MKETTREMGTDLSKNEQRDILIWFFLDSVDDFSISSGFGHFYESAMDSTLPGTGGRTLVQDIEHALEKVSFEKILDMIKEHMGRDARDEEVFVINEEYLQTPFGKFLVEIRFSIKDRCMKSFIDGQEITRNYNFDSPVEYKNLIEKTKVVFEENQRKIAGIRILKELNSMKPAYHEIPFIVTKKNTKAHRGSFISLETHDEEYSGAYSCFLIGIRENQGKVQGLAINIYFVEDLDFTLREVDPEDIHDVQPAAMGNWGLMREMMVDHYSKIHSKYEVVVSLEEYTHVFDNHTEIVLAWESGKSLDEIFMQNTLVRHFIEEKKFQIQKLKQEFKPVDSFKTWDQRYEKGSEFGEEFTVKPGKWYYTDNTEEQPSYVVATGIEKVNEKWVPRVLVLVDDDGFYEYSQVPLQDFQGEHEDQYPFEKALERSYEEFKSAVARGRRLLPDNMVSFEKFSEVWTRRKQIINLWLQGMSLAHIFRKINFKYATRL